MEEVELVVLLLAVVAAGTLLAGRIGIPYPILLVMVGLMLGLVIGLVPDAPRVELDPDTVLLVFLPPILFSTAFFLSPRELWRNVRPISLLAVGLVITTTLAVAGVARVLVPEIPWAAALALGAIVSPPDAIAATAIGRRLNLPRRIVFIMEGEGLVNDATALTIYRLAIVAAGAATLGLGEAAATFAFVAIGGIAVGLVIGAVALWLLSLFDDPPVEVLVSLIVPFAAYLPAESIGVSGVLSTVAAGLLVGWRSSRVMSSNTRILGTATWKMVIFVVNGLAFLLIGLQLPTVIEDVRGREPMELLGIAAAIALTVIAVRLIWIYPATYLPRWLIPSVARRDPAPPARVPLILGWAGMRGAVSLAAALALPLNMGSGNPFPERGLLIFLTFSVILVTLIGQGLTLPVLIRRLGVTDDGQTQHEEIHARTVAAEAALERLDSLETEVPGHVPLINQLRDRYRHQREHLDHDHQDDAAEGLGGVEAVGGAPGPAEMTPEEVEEMEHDDIRRAVIAAERLAIIALRDRGEIGDDALRTVERDLDLDELRREA